MARYATGTATEIQTQRDSNPVPTSASQQVAAGKDTSYVGRYVMLGYTWVVFEKFLYFFREMGTFFQ